MTEARSLLVLLCDPRLAPHATAGYPVWLWSADATRILWGNAAAAAIFNAASPHALTRHAIDPKGSAALQIARLAGTLPHGATPRLEQLRGFGGRFGGALMCGCSRIMLSDRTPGILVVSTAIAGPALSLAEHAQRLLAGCDEALALFAADGVLLHATEAAQQHMGQATTLAALDVAPLAAEALTAGRASGDGKTGHLSLDRIGNGASTVLLASFGAQAAEDARPAEPRVSPASAAPPTMDETVTSTPEPSPPSPMPAPPVASTSERRQPLRFVWQMDVGGRFTVDSDEFVALVGPQTASTLGRPWGEIASALGLDPEGQVARAFGSHETWSGITVTFPMDGTDARLPVELSGLPVFDRDRSFRGYRGFGICRDAARIVEVTRLHQDAPSAPRAEPPMFRQEPPVLTIVPPVENVLPFRSSAPPDKPPTLTSVERNAFSELASRLSARLRAGDSTETLETRETEPSVPSAPPAAKTMAEPADDAGARATSTDQRPILDRLPIGVLVYRLDKLIYANRAFLDWTGYGELRALEDAGGLDALFVEPAGGDLTTNNGAKTLSIATNRGDQLPVEARLFTSPWEGESALVLMLTGADGGHAKADEIAPSGDGKWRAVLDATTDGIVVIGPDRTVLMANRAAEELFGYAGDAWTGLPFGSLFGPEAQRVALEYINGTDPAAPEGGREVSGRRRNGGMIPLLMTVAPVDDNRLCVTFRDITRWKKAEYDLTAAKRQAEAASSAKTDFLAKLSHEIRTPLNAIIGFAEVMTQERFGPISNERYRQYLKDIRTSGAHVVALLNDLLDLSKIEAGKLELNFDHVDLNGLTQECVALMQPQASRERIIIRSSLGPELPPVTADARSVRQILLNILSNSIKFTGAGGQVIVSTALGDAGDVVLRVRDTGVGMSEQDLAIALEPFRQLATSARFGSSGTGLGLPLTKALAEANRASFKIRSAVNAGTLVEVAFQGTRLAAE